MFLNGKANLLSIDTNNRTIYVSFTKLIQKIQTETMDTYFEYVLTVVSPMVDFLNMFLNHYRR